MRKSAGNSASLLRRLGDVELQTGNGPPPICANPGGFDLVCAVRDDRATTAWRVR